MYCDVQISEAGLHGSVLRPTLPHHGDSPTSHTVLKLCSGRLPHAVMIDKLVITLSYRLPSLMHVESV